MKHTFVINDDSIVNEYGYRVLNAGLDTAQFMRNPVVLYLHERGDYKPKGDEVIGKVTDIRMSGAQMLADVEFDTEDEFAKKIAGKVERGFVRMASIYADIKETSISQEDILPGQLFETVTKSKLVELSIVPIGGNDNALKLNRDGKPIQLSKINTNTMNIKTIALALGMDEASKEEDVLSRVQKIQLQKNKAEQRVRELETAQLELRKAEAGKLIDKAVQLGLINEAFKESQTNVLINDFDNQKAVLTKLIADKESADDTEGKHGAVKTVILGAGKKGKGSVVLTYDYLQKHDPEQLKQIRDTQPETYVQLAKDYGRGVRHEG